MKRLVVMILSISLVLFLGSLLGVQHMNETLGISQPERLLIHSKETNPPTQVSLEVAIDIEDLKQKRLHVENVGKFNFFSDVGTQLADEVNSGSRAFLSRLMAFVHEVLNGEGKREEI